MAQSAYPTHFPVVEIQDTFYQPPTAQVLDRWRAVVPSDFEFTLKAWQLITHTSKSPTYQRLKRVLSSQEEAEAGAFRDTEIVADGWRITLECALRLRATAILFQCPASFRPTPENLAATRAFFSRIVRPAGMRILLEPRGPEWTPALGRAFCDEIDAVHVVDPFVTSPVDRSDDTLRYFRLHGITGARHMYSDSELLTLAELVRRPVSTRTYVMFNNIPRLADALRFAKLLEA